MRAPNLQALLDKLRGRKRAIQAAFAQSGTPIHNAWADFARFCHAFDCEDFPDDRDRMLIYFGRREAFFWLYSHLKLEPEELAQLYRAAVIKQGDQ